MKSEIHIKKASGEKSLFSEDKIRHSLERAGADTEQVNFITDEVKKKLYNGISTKEIYHIAFALLRSRSRPFAARYRLKQAIMELGPSGYPFEKYIGEILRHQGYQIRAGEIVQGHCVSHEIDVIAKKEDHCYMVECKYHNQRGIFCDVKVPLYIHSRFKDVESEWIKLNGNSFQFYQAWVVTNTRFSDDAIKYGSCAGLYLLGWDYPVKMSLKEQVDKLGLYPITCLTSLTKSEKQRLLNRKIVLCKEISGNERLLEMAGVKESRIHTVMKEAQQLCKDLALEKTQHAV